eukprot:1936435-Alexandrium_andersonii.AAC.1
MVGAAGGQSVAMVEESARGAWSAWSAWSAWPGLLGGSRRPWSKSLPGGHGQHGQHGQRGRDCSGA